MLLFEVQMCVSVLCVGVMQSLFCKAHTKNINHKVTDNLISFR